MELYEELIQRNRASLSTIPPINFIIGDKEIIEKNMTIKELIERLKQFPENIEIMASCEDDYFLYEICDIYPYTNEGILDTIVLDIKANNV